MIKNPLDKNVSARNIWMDKMGPWKEIAVEQIAEALNLTVEDKWSS